MKMKRASNGMCGMHVSHLSIKHVGSRLQAVEGMLNSNDSSKQRVARQARRGRVRLGHAAVCRAVVQCSGGATPGVSVFFQEQRILHVRTASRVWHGHVFERL